MGAKSRRKGKTGELEAAALFREHGFDARRGRQYQGGQDSPDLVTELDDHFHMEIKRTERLSLYDAVEQASRDAGDERVPVVLHRRNHCDWLVVMRAEDWFELVREAV